jgi:hypothetical protein
MGYVTPPPSTAGTGFRRANGLNEFYSILKQNGNIELYIDKAGNPTTSYPHVHVIHRGAGQVDVVASVSDGNHVWRTTLQNASGSEVENAIAIAQSKI